MYNHLSHPYLNYYNLCDLCEEIKNKLKTEVYSIWDYGFEKTPNDKLGEKIEGVIGTGVAFRNGFIGTNLHVSGDHSASRTKSAKNWRGDVVPIQFWGGSCQTQNIPSDTLGMTQYLLPESKLSANSKFVDLDAISFKQCDFAIFKSEHTQTTQLKRTETIYKESLCIILHHAFGNRNLGWTLCSITGATIHGIKMKYLLGVEPNINGLKGASGAPVYLIDFDNNNETTLIGLHFAGDQFELLSLNITILDYWFSRFTEDFLQQEVEHKKRQMESFRISFRDDRNSQLSDRMFDVQQRLLTTPMDRPVSTRGYDYIHNQSMNPYYHYAQPSSYQGSYQHQPQYQSQQSMNPYYHYAQPSSYQGSYQHQPRFQYQSQQQQQPKFKNFLPL